MTHTGHQYSVSVQLSSVFSFQYSQSRLPQEHLLLQGFGFDVIKAIPYGRHPKAIGEVAGNAMALPVIECILSALAHTFPDTFQRNATP